MADPPPFDTIVADPPPFDTIVWEGRTWLVGRRLGAGKFAVVHEATCRELPSKRVAAKVINTAHLSKWAQAQLAIEIDVWKALDHRFIVKLYGSMAQGDFLVLFLELAEGGELFERLVERESFVEEEAARLMRQLLSALVYMHERGVIHRDLKPENLLLDSASDRASLRIADFGAAKQLTDLTGTLPSALASTPCGSLGYAAPEQLRQQLYERQCDLWSAGVVAYVLLSGCMPFDPSTYAGSSFALVFPEELFGGVTPAAVDFIRSLLQINPLLRPTAAKAMAHPWLMTDAPMPTPLPTPQQLGILKRSGDMGGKFSHASDLWLYSCATTPAAQALEGARKCQRGGDGRAGGNMLLVLSEEPDVPILALPDMRAYRAPLRGGIISARAIESALVRRGCGMRLLGGGGMG